MNLFYEDSGQFKVAAVVQKNDSTYQADTQHGKRVKIKAANVFLEFDGDMDAFMQNAQDEAAAIEQRIATDEKLTDDDKALLQKEADKLKRAGMTDEDKLSTLYKEKYQLEKQITDGTLTAGEVVNTMRAKDESIANLQNIIKEKAEHTDALRRQSVQERADLEAATAKEKENAAPKEDNATANAVTSLTAALTKKALDDAESKDKDDAGHKDAARSE